MILRDLRDFTWHVWVKIPDPFYFDRQLSCKWVMAKVGQGCFEYSNIRIFDRRFYIRICLPNIRIFDLFRTSLMRTLEMLKLDSRTFPKSPGRHVLSGKCLRSA